ncbi:NUDIX hydrolase [Gulosibacter macacae]|uniref:NUDIX hydrolase n=1 Tax=Gulosibacter macacae TaxID=2488791 RepID=A0A3P3W3V6_9MICO|nr:NUDIX domain-containing protein [Gulosibacter macacae]RRJ87513.1 NUDIX hydrolase [Gulosibacter macacae]
MPVSVDPDTTVYAAGALLWRVEAGKIRVLLIHRERHGDYSLPKGKVDAGETLPETAVREVWEETGYRVALGAPLGFIDYVLPSGRPKEVHYWSCEIGEADYQAHEFRPNSEVDQLEWMSPKKALARLSYERDREVVQLLLDRIERGVARTFPIIALRHSKAVPPLSWPGDDDSRPLTARGKAQSEQIVPILRAYLPQRIVTSTAVRCRATIAPLAHEVGITPESVRALSQSASASDGAIRQVFDGILAARDAVVVCSHSPVMPEIVSSLAHATQTRLSGLSRQAMLSTAECSVMHVPSDDPSRGIVAAETHGPII